MEPEPNLEIIAEYDDDAISVYQAFRPEIADEALALGHFGPAFRLDRMTWIKPSFGWMLHRSGCASKPDQERVLKLRLAHQHVLALLADAVPSSFERARFADRERWRQALEGSDVRVQWDPDRDWRDRVMARRAIQIGFRGEFVERYARAWIRVSRTSPRSRTRSPRRPREATHRRAGPTSACIRCLSSCGSASG